MNAFRALIGASAMLLAYMPSASADRCLPARCVELPLQLRATTPEMTSSLPSPSSSSSSSSSPSSPSSPSSMVSEHQRLLREFATRQSDARDWALQVGVETVGWTASAYQRGWNLGNAGFLDDALNEIGRAHV